MSINVGTQRFRKHNCIIWGSGHATELLEHEQDFLKVNLLCTPAHERVIGPFFLDKDIITNNSSLDTMENYVLQQLNSADPILQLDRAPVHFSHIVRYCLNVKFSGRWIEEEKQFCAPLVLLNFALFGLSFLWDCVKDRAHSQTVNIPDGLKARLTALIANVVKDMLRRVWYNVDHMWDVYRDTYAVQCEVFRT
jgi:hypothetical protein